MTSMLIDRLISLVHFTDTFSLIHCLSIGFSLLVGMLLNWAGNLLYANAWYRKLLPASDVVVTWPNCAPYRICLGV